MLKGDHTMARTHKGDKFPLLIYQRWGKMLRLPGLLIAIASGIIWWFSPQHPLLEAYAWVFIVVGAVGALVFLYSILAHRAAYVQCLPKYIKIRTPFTSFAISYGRVLQVRPIEFYSQLPIGKMKRTQIRLLEPYLGHTAILLELNGFPGSERRLRTWLPWFMFTREVTGFLLVVKDWMALSRQISVFSDSWVARRQARQRPLIGRRY
jgi:hypothetical protein